MSSPPGPTRCSAPVFVALSPEHPLTQELAKTDKKLQDFIAECRKTGTAEAEIEKAEKLGFDTGLTAAHPFDPNWKLPVMVANFVLMGYGTGAIFGCPAHDQRDLDFARKYGLSVTPVVVPSDADPKTFAIGNEAYTGPGKLANSHFLDGMTVEQAKAEVATRLEATRRRRAHGELPPARLAGVAPAALGLPDPDDPLRQMRRGAGARKAICRCCCRRRSISPRPAIRWIATRPGRPPTCPDCGGAGDARHRHARHLRGFVLVFRPLHRQPCRSSR